MRGNAMEPFRRWIVFNIWYLFGKAPWDTGISPPELTVFIQTHPPGRALDLGSGTGRNVLTLAEAGWTVVGVDFAMRAVAAARRRLKTARVQADLRLGDVTRLEGIRGKFDLILDIGCYHGLSAAGCAAYRENLKRLLVPNGTFLLYAHVHGPESSSRSGINEEDIETLAYLLCLEQRQDSQDPSGPRSTWLTFCGFK
jgi:SAM-dependent methyltransferase